MVHLSTTAYFSLISSPMDIQLCSYLAYGKTKNTFNFEDFMNGSKDILFLPLMCLKRTYLMRKQLADTWNMVSVFVCGTRERNADVDRGRIYIRAATSIRVLGYPRIRTEDRVRIFAHADNRESRSYPCTLILCRTYKPQ